MKKFLVRRYIDSVDPSEVSQEDRAYCESLEELIEMYGMDTMSSIAEGIYGDDDSADIFRVIKDEYGYYVTTYTCVQNEEVNEEEEIFELFQYKLIKLTDNIYVTAHDRELHSPDPEDFLLIVEER